MAKSQKPKRRSKKAAVKVPAKKSKAVVATLRGDLANAIAPLGGAAVAASVKVDFFGGVGTVTVALFRQGLMINMQSINTQGTVAFSDVAQGDRITVNGFCAGSTKVTITVPTSPATPYTHPDKEIHLGFIVL